MKPKLLLLVLVVLILALAGWGWSWYWNHPLFGKLRAPEGRIEEVIIRPYGDISPDVSSAAKSAVEDEIGVAVRVDGVRPSFSSFGPLYYDESRDQYDADLIWDSEQAFNAGNETRRLVMLVDVDVYTTIQSERPYVLSRSTPNINVVLINVARIQRESDESTVPASASLIEQRLKKLILRTLGVSVFLEGGPYFTRDTGEECVMYRGRILAELDAQGDKFCEENQKRLSERFVTGTKP